VTLGNEFLLAVLPGSFRARSWPITPLQDGPSRGGQLHKLGDDYSSGLGNFLLKAIKALAGDDSIVARAVQTKSDRLKGHPDQTSRPPIPLIFAPPHRDGSLLIKQARELGITAKIWRRYWENVPSSRIPARTPRHHLNQTSSTRPTSTRADFETGFKG
jgi:branched-chain amino acid transport system substrate-binding protein